MSFVPSDDMLLEKIMTIQNTLGADIGLQKIYDNIKAEHPLWMFGIKRLRTIRKDQNLAPSPPTSDSQPANPVVQQASGPADPSNNLTVPERLTHTLPSKIQQTRGLSVLQMRLTFDVSSGRDKRTYVFEKPVPRKFCVVNNEREAAFTFVTRLIADCEQEIVASQPWRCANCGRPATHVYSSPFVDFNTRPPSVVSDASRPVCGVATTCHALAHEANMDTLNGLHANGTLPRSALPEEPWVFHQHTTL